MDCYGCGREIPPAYVQYLDVMLGGESPFYSGGQVYMIESHGDRPHCLTCARELAGWFSSKPTYPCYACGSKFFLRSFHFCAHCAVVLCEKCAPSSGWFSRNCPYCGCGVSGY